MVNTAPLQIRIFKIRVFLFIAARERDVWLNETKRIFIMATITTVRLVKNSTDTLINFILGPCVLSKTNGKNKIARLLLFTDCRGRDPVQFRFTIENKFFQKINLLAVPRLFLTRPVNLCLRASFQELILIHRVIVWKIREDKRITCPSRKSCPILLTVVSKSSRLEKIANFVAI